MDVIKPKEGDTYTLEVSYWNKTTLKCTFVSDNHAFFKAMYCENSYKLNLKTNKLYVWNSMYSSWDNVQEKLKPLYEGDEEEYSSYKQYKNFLDFGD